MDSVPSKMPVIPKRNARCNRTGSGSEDHFIGKEYWAKVKKDPQKRSIGVHSGIF
jgi:hypothetical protein